MVSRGPGRCEGAGQGEHGPKVFDAGGLRRSHVAQRPLPILQAFLSGGARWDQLAAWRQGESAMGHGGPQSPALWSQAPLEGTLGPDLWLGLAPGGRLARAKGCAVRGGRVEVRALGMGTWA